jgi:hypothetical protein
LGYVGGGPLTPAVLGYARRVDRAYGARMTVVGAFFAGDVARADADLRAAGKPALATSGATRAAALGVTTPTDPGASSATDPDN